MAWQFPPAIGASYPGQQSILVLLGQQSRMPMREQRFLICYKEMLAVETTTTSANLWNSCFHQNSGDSSSPCFAGQQSRMLMSEQQFLTFYNEILTIENTVTSANLWNSCFHQNSGDSSSPCFAGTAVHLNLLGQQSRMLMSEQQFLIFYNEMLTIEIAVSSANL